MDDKILAIAFMLSFVMHAFIIIMPNMVSTEAGSSNSCTKNISVNLQAIEIPKKPEKTIKKTQPKKEVIKKRKISKNIKKIQKNHFPEKILSPLNATPNIAAVIPTLNKEICKIPALLPTPSISMLPEKKDGESKASNKESHKLVFNYQKLIRSKIAENKNYPYWARKQGFEGQVYLSFCISANGFTEDIQILSSSGYKILDDAAKSTIKNASPFPAIPTIFGKDKLAMKIKLSYHLN